MVQTAWSSAVETFMIVTDFQFSTSARRKAQTDFIANFF